MPKAPTEQTSVLKVKGVKAKTMDQLFLLEQQKENVNNKDLKFISSLKSCLSGVFLLEDSASLKDL